MRDKKIKIMMILSEIKEQLKNEGLDAEKVDILFDILEKQND